jgi:hypothetical protein
MYYRKDEVTMLLRKPLKSDDDINFAQAAAEAGLMFMDEVIKFTYISKLKLTNSIIVESCGKVTKYSTRDIVKMVITLR